MTLAGCNKMLPSAFSRNRKRLPGWPGRTTRPSPSVSMIWNRAIRRRYRWGRRRCLEVGSFGSRRYRVLSAKRGEDRHGLSHFCHTAHEFTDELARCSQTFVMDNRDYPCASHGRRWRISRLGRQPNPRGDEVIHHVDLSARFAHWVPQPEGCLCTDLQDNRTVIGSATKMRRTAPPFR